MTTWIASAVRDGAVRVGAVALVLAIGLVLAVGALAGPTAPSRPAGAAEDGALRLRVLSSPARFVSGGDALLGLRGTRDPADLVVRVDGQDRSDDFPFASQQGRLVALVSGLDDGPHRVEVRDGDRRASVRLVSHPASGPVISGPHGPLLCTVTGGPAPTVTADTACTEAARTSTTWQYRTPSGTFVPLADPNVVPPDVGRITGQPGVPDGTPFVVRVERGVVNRTPYEIAVLDPVPTTPIADAWNERLVYLFGGGCGTLYSQGSPLGASVLDASLLQRGYGLASANFNTFQTSCNDVLSAETTMMVKERFIETVGVPEHTIGSGASGGAIQQLLIAQNYPGLLDGLVPLIPFPDAISIAPGVADCGLLEAYYGSESGRVLTEAQRAAINGHAVPRTCSQWVSLFLSNIDPGRGCDPRIPADRIWSTTNRSGIRCTLQDFNVNLFGVDPETDVARRPLDNVGVQYGLDALESGAITVDQFLDLNERIGGYDIDGRITPQRMSATRSVIRRSYATGRVLAGGGALDVPIVLVNLYTDLAGDIHDRQRLFAIRERIDAAGGDADDVVIWTLPSDGNLVRNLTGQGFNPTEPIELVDAWLTDGEAPAGAVDRCVDRAGAVTTGAEANEAGACAESYPVHGDPRTAAGAPLINDVLKCRRTSVDPDDYGVEMTPQQVDRLERIFPDGVCDWERRGVGQVPLAATWIDYGRAPWAVDVGDAPERGSAPSVSAAP